MDNGTREGLEKFLNAASSEPETVLHYEFMQDYKVSYSFSAIVPSRIATRKKFSYTS